MAIRSNKNIPADIIPTYNLFFVSNLMIVNWVLRSPRQHLIQSHGKKENNIPK